MSFLPPAMTIRHYHRKVLATTSNEIGTIYCAIVSYANTRREEDVSEIVKSLTAVRSKLNRCVVIRTNAVYEVCLVPFLDHFCSPHQLLMQYPALASWAMAVGEIPQPPGDPNVRLSSVNAAQPPNWTAVRQLAYGLSNLMSVFKHLEPAWARALLRRTRFLDTDFQGDILAVMSEFLAKRASPCGI